jgi:AcrR family transcriptional regulator
MTKALSPSSSRRTSGRHRGRPVDASRESAILVATQGLLAEMGYERLTIDAVAEKAHASKATIYRRWRSKGDLVIDAVSSLAPIPDLADRGSLENDLRTLLGHNEIVSTFRLNLMSGLVSAVARDPELARVFRDRFLAPRAKALRQLFERAVARGELPPDRDLDLLTAVFPALLYHRATILGRSVDSGYLQRVLEQVLLPLVRDRPSSRRVSHSPAAGPVRGAGTGPAAATASDGLPTPSQREPKNPARREQACR